MALDEDLKKKIANRLSSRTTEQKQISQQSVQESAIRERVRSIAPKDVIPTITPKKDLTSRIMFSNVRAPLGGDNLLGSFARLSNDIARSVIESTVVGGLRTASQLTPGGLTIPGLGISTDVSFGGDNLQKIEGKIPTFSEAAIKRQYQLDQKRPDKLFLNTLQAASEEIFLPLWDAIPILGAATTGAITTARKLATTPEARNAFLTIGFKVRGDKAVTETGIRSAIQNTARKNIKELEEGKISPEEYLAKQSEIGKAVDVINGGQTRFGRFGVVLNDATNSLTQERTLSKYKVTLSPEGIPIIRNVEEIEKTQELLAQQNKALRGEMEEMRLSNANILAGEIKNSKILGDTNVDSSLNVFTIGNRQLKPGARVSLDRETARGIVGNAPREVGVKVDDLVQLPDGSFAYAPKSMIDSGADAISTVRKTVKDEILKSEKKVKLQQKVRESLENSKRLADEQEATRLAKEQAEKVTRETARKTDAEKAIKESRVEIAKRKADVDIEVAKDMAKVEAKESVAKASLKSAVDNLKTISSSVKAAETKVKDIQKILAKAKKNGKATALITKNLTKAKSDLTNAKKAERTAQTVAKKARESVPTDTKIKVTEINAKADVRKAEIVAESKKAVTEAKAVIKEIDNANKVPSTRYAERLQAKVDKLEGRKAKLIEAYGGIDEVPVDKIKVIDDAIAELGNVETLVATTNKTSKVVTTKVQELNNLVENSIENAPTGVREKSLKYFRENPDEVAKGEIRLREIEDGKIVIEDGRHRLTVAAELGIKPNLVDVTAEYTGKTSEKITKIISGIEEGKQVPTKTSEEVATAQIKPVKIEGTDVNTSALAKRLTDGLKGMVNTPEFNVATHAKQTENALNYIGKHGVDDTLSMIEKGSFPEGTTKASLVSSLMEAIDSVTDDALKLNYTNRLAAYIPELSEFATRAGQEIEALKILHKDNPVMKIMRIQRLLNSDKNVERVADEVAKLEKQLSKIDTKSIIKEAIDKSTCLS